MALAGNFRGFAGDGAAKRLAANLQGAKEDANESGSGRPESFLKLLVRCFRTLFALFNLL